MNLIKVIKRQDSGWKQQPGFSGETSINLSHEICKFLTFGLVSEGEELEIPFIIYKEDFLSALDFIKSQLPLYRSTSKTCKLVYIDDLLLKKISRSLDVFFDGSEKVEYKIVLYYRRDGRIYLKDLKHNGFTIRDFLVEDCSSISFQMVDGAFVMRIFSALSEP